MNRTDEDHAVTSKKQSKRDRKKSYKCPNCNKSFQLLEKYQQHLRSHLLTYHPYECEDCLESFSHFAYLRKHKQSHDKNKSFPCPECPQTFFNMFGLNRHLIEHYQSPPYSCSWCSATFPTVASRSRHMKNHVISCGMCEIPFASHRQLRDHILERHKRRDSDNEEPNPVNPYQKDEFSSLNNDSDVVNSSNENLQCFVCEQWLSSKDTYDVHLKAHRVFTCSCCPQFFPLKSLLLEHEYKCHGIHPYKCNKCDLELNSAGEFKLHEQSCKKDKSLVSQDPCHILLNTVANLADVPTDKKYEIEKFLKGVLEKNELDSMFSNEQLFTQKLESCRTPIFDLNRSSHFKWVSDFAERLKSVEFPLGDYVLTQVLHVHKTIVEALHHTSGELRKADKFFYLMNVQHELATMLTEHLKHISEQLL